MLRLALPVLLLASFGGFAIVGWAALHQGPARVSVPVAIRHEPELSVLVATVPLHAGQLVRPEDLGARSLPATAVTPGALTDTSDTRRNLTGALLRVSVPTGGFVLSQEVVRPGDHGYLAAVLTPGKRAVSIGVDAVSGIAGLVWPGDYVDLILTQTIEEPNVPPARRMAAETVLTGLRVIATDQDLVRGEKPASAGIAERTITLEATPAQAERIMIAGRLGRLSLSVCPLAECAGDAPKATTTWGGDLSPALSASEGGNGDTVHFFDGSTEQKDFHF